MLTLGSQNQRAMAGHDAALGMDQAEPGTGNLPGTRSATQLAHDLGEVKHRTWIAGMAVGQQAAVRVDGQGPTQRNVAGFDESTAFAFGAESKILQFDQHHRRKAVVDTGDINVPRG